MFLHNHQIIELHWIKFDLFLVNKEDIDFVSEGDDNLNGPCTVQLKSGFSLGGCWRKGQRKGPGNVLNFKLTKKMTNVKSGGCKYSEFRVRFHLLLDFFQEGTQFYQNV